MHYHRKGKVETRGCEEFVELLSTELVISVDDQSDTFAALIAIRECNLNKTHVHIGAPTRKTDWQN